MRYACTAFYSHPWAWNEIGFGGPAYPTGYKNLGVERREPWEVAERDATDPVPWARRVERARDRAQRAGMSVPRPQRVGLAAAQRRDPDQPPSAGATCATSTTTTRSTSPSSAAAPAAACSPSDSPGRDGRSSRSTPGRSGTPTTTGSATSAAPTTSTGPTRESSPATTRCRWRATTPAAASVAGRCTSPATRPGSTLRTSSTYSRDGVGADWPIGYADLKPHYEDMEDELPVAGAALALGRPAPLPALAPSRERSRGDLHPRVPARGHRRQGRARGHHERALRQPPPLHLPRVLPAGLQGQRQGVDADHPRPRRAGARCRDPRRRDGQPHRGRPPTGAPCAVALLPGRRRAPPTGPGRRCRRYAIETPRLLLNSAEPRFPDGLCNDHDLVGRYVMVQGAAQTAGRFAGEVRMYKAPPPEVSTEAFYETDPTKPYKRGFSIQCVGPLPITWAEHVVAEGHWGARPPRVHARLRPLGHHRGAVRVPPAGRQPGDPGRRDAIGTACRSPGSRYSRCATTTRP